MEDATNTCVALAAQLQHQQDNISVVTLQQFNAVKAVIDASPDTCVTNLLSRMTTLELNKIQAFTNNKEDLRLKQVAKSLFSQQMTAVQHSSSVLKLSESLLQEVTNLAFFSEFMTDGCSLEWSRYSKCVSKAMLDKAVEQGRQQGRAEAGNA